MTTKIICRAADCIFNENKICTSNKIVYDPEEGCLTYEVLEDLIDLDDEDWDDDELLDDDESLEWDDDEDLFLDDEDLDLDEDEEEDDEWDESL